TRGEAGRAVDVRGLPPGAEAPRLRVRPRAGRPAAERAGVPRRRSAGAAGRRDLRGASAEAARVQGQGAPRAPPRDREAAGPLTGKLASKDGTLVMPRT